MRVLFISGREAAYQRNRVILKGLRKNGVEVDECTSLSSSYLLRYPEVLLKFLRRRSYDLLFVGFFGQPLVPLLRRFVRKPVLFDAFLSAYDTMCFDRKTIQPHSVAGRMLSWLDKRSCELADTVLLDTNSHIDFFVEAFKLDRSKFERVFVGADEDVFFPRTSEEHEGFLVLYYGTFLPLQGIEYIVEAAKLLESYEDMRFKIIGKGMTYARIMRLAEKLGVENIRFVDWVPYKVLPSEIAEADICLGGHFSAFPKAFRVIPEKVFQMIAMKKPVILGNGPGNKELFEHKRNAFFCETANPEAIADAIARLKSDPSLRERIGENGYRTFRQKCTPDIIGREIRDIAGSLLE